MLLLIVGCAKDKPDEPSPEPAPAPCYLTDDNGVILTTDSGEPLTCD